MNNANYYQDFKDTLANLYKNRLDDQQFTLTNRLRSLFKDFLDERHRINNSFSIHCDPTHLYDEVYQEIVQTADQYFGKS